MSGGRIVRALAVAAGLFASSAAFASPEQCAAHWVERNRPFAERGLCVDTPLWQAAFPNGNCTQTSGSDISLPPEIADRLNEVRTLETQLGCRMDSQMDDPVRSARSLWVDNGDQASIFSAKDGFANVRNAPSAKSGALTGMLENGSQVRVLERVQSPDNGAAWFRISYPDNTGRLHNAFVHYATVFPRREVMGFLDIAPAAQMGLIDLGADDKMPLMLRARFWTEDHPSDIWPVLSYPSYTRSGQEQRKFSVAFTALDWKGEELETVSSKCEWQPNKRNAACSGGAGRFSIVAARDSTTWALRSLGIIFDSSAGDAGRLVPAGFNRQLDIGAITGRVQLGIAVDGTETLKMGLLYDSDDENARPASTPAPAAAAPEPEPASAAAAPAPAPAPEKFVAPFESNPGGSGNALDDLDALLELIE